MRYTFTLQQPHYQELRENLIRGDGLERIAFILCGRSYIASDPWDSMPEERFLSRKVIILPNSKVVDSSPVHVTWETDFFVKLLKEVEEQSLAITVVHNHPDGYPDLSEKDKVNETKLFRILHNRNEIDRPHASLVITHDGGISGHIWDTELRTHPIDLIRVFGNEFKIFYSNKGQGDLAKAFHRQELAFGKALNHELSKLRIAVVGCGGTGSATATLLARLGVGKILLIDEDYVDETNLNRMHCASISDAKAKRSKVHVLESAIKNMGLGTGVKAINKWVESGKNIDSLKSCDIVFGCTDDHQGRLLLNRLAYFYLLPVIDMGLIIKVSEAEPPEISVLDGRVTALFPRNVCLICRNVINPEIARAEGLRRNDSEGYRELKKEAYVIGEGDPSPAVMTFTTEIAIMAVNEFIHRIQGFRGPDGSASERRRLFIHCEDRKTGGKIRKGCDLCDKQNFWGRGDMEPFLNRI
jgi:molybdopterin/thiamine biosynthesis adenylyltransferase